MKTLLAPLCLASLISTAALGAEPKPAPTAEQKAAPTAEQKPAPAPDVEADKAAIRQTILDYIEGYYEGDAARMERALHPDLAKRIVRNMGPRSRVENMSALQLVQVVRTGEGKSTPAEKRLKNITIFEVYNNVAVARCEASDWVDFFQLGRVDGRWVVINVLWEMKPGTMKRVVRPNP